jgi:cyclopropane fatty-acyl-phospholipid synthase-like methyltransferase
MAFPQALPIVFERPHRKLLDVGGNTGKWAIQCARYSADVSVTILDLPGIAAATARSIEELGLRERITTQAIDLLDRSRPFPGGFDAIWMSQFLVCFDEDDALGILERAAAAMGPDSTLYILDTFWDRQKFEASTYCLQAISLYFTCLANGCSRMYKASDVTAMVEAAGMKVERVIDDLGISSSLLICRR